MGVASFLPELLHAASALAIQHISMPDFSTLACVAGIGRIPLLCVLSLRDPEFIGLAAALGTLPIGFLLRS